MPPLPVAESAEIDRNSQAVAAAFGGCALEQYQELRIKQRSVSGEVIAYRSPDSTYAVTKTLLG